MHGKAPLSNGGAARLIAADIDALAARSLPDLLSKRRSALRWRAGVLSVGALACGLLLVALAHGDLHFDRRALLALLAGGAAAAATAAGTLPVLFSRSHSQRAFDCFLGFGAGVMLAATTFSLLVPALVSAAQLLQGQQFGRLYASAGVAVGMLAGAGAIIGLARLVSAMSLPAEPGEAAMPTAATLKRVWLFMLAVTLHNMPEGLAIGVAFAGIDIEKASSVATGIAVQDIPEGLVIAMAFRSVGFSRLRAAGLGVASGLIEPVMAVAGAMLVGLSSALLPIGLAAAAGAMLYVIVNEVVPETHTHGHGKLASCSLVLGFAAMLILDTALG